jgi:hypothetical protein
MEEQGERVFKRRACSWATADSVLLHLGILTRRLPSSHATRPTADSLRAVIGMQLRGGVLSFYVAKFHEGAEFLSSLDGNAIVNELPATPALSDSHQTPTSTDPKSRPVGRYAWKQLSVRFNFVADVGTGGGTKLLNTVEVFRATVFFTHLYQLSRPILFFSGASRRDQSSPAKHLRTPEISIIKLVFYRTATPVSVRCKQNC